MELDDYIRDFINAPIMQRIKYVDLSGPIKFMHVGIPGISRFDHCIGVWALLKKVGASKQEQIAGLLHDTSHTVFSHVADFLFSEDSSAKEYKNSSYQDTTHMQFLSKMNIYPILEKHGLTLEDVDIDQKEYLALEQPLPDICADRIDYNIRTGVAFKIISKDEAHKIINDLQYVNKKWFFINIENAAILGKLSINFTKNFWGKKEEHSIMIHFAKALKRALKISLIYYDDLYSTDDIVFNRLADSKDSIIQLMLKQCREPVRKFSEYKYKKIKVYPKFRGIDPLVKSLHSRKMLRLTELDQEFKKEFKFVNSWCQKGYEIDILEVS